MDLLVNNTVCPEEERKSDGKTCVVVFLAGVCEMLRVYSTCMQVPVQDFDRHQTGQSLLLPMLCGVGSVCMPMGARETVRLGTERWFSHVNSPNLLNRERRQPSCETCLPKQWEAARKGISQEAGVPWAYVVSSRGDEECRTRPRGAQCMIPEEHDNKKSMCRSYQHGRRMRKVLH